MKPLTYLLAITGTLCSYISGQTVAELVPGQSHPVIGLTSDQFELPIKCDGDGNVYLRSSFGAVEITKIAPDGTKKGSFGSAVSEIKDLGLYDFFPAEDGKLYLLLDGAEADVAEFDGNAKFERLIKLDAGRLFRPEQFVVLSDGQFFISGNSIEAGKSAKKYPFSGMFDVNGKLAREVLLKEDETANPENGKANREGASLPFRGYLLGRDGNIYIFQKGNPILAYVVSQSGHLLRTLKIKQPNPKYQPAVVKMGDGHIAVEFQLIEASNQFEATEHIIRIADTETGKTLIDYQGSSLLTGMFACYGSEKFTFLTGNEHLALTEVATH